MDADTCARIAQLANEAARLAALTGIQQQCPYPPGSDAAHAWRAAYLRYLLFHSVPDGEASA